MKTRLPDVSPGKSKRPGEVVRTIEGELPIGISEELTEHFAGFLGYVFPVDLDKGELEAMYPYHPVQVTHAYEASLEEHMNGTVTISCGGGFTQVRIMPSWTILTLVFLTGAGGYIFSPLIFPFPDTFSLVIHIAFGVFFASLGVVLVWHLLKGFEKVADELCQKLLEFRSEVNQ